MTRAPVVSPLLGFVFAFIAADAHALNVQAADLGKLRLCETQVEPDYRGLPLPSSAPNDLDYTTTGRKRLIMGKTTAAQKRHYEIAYWLIDVGTCEFGALVVSGTYRRAWPAKANVFFLSSTGKKPKARWRGWLLDKLKQRPRTKRHPSVAGFSAGAPPGLDYPPPVWTGYEPKEAQAAPEPTRVASDKVRWLRGSPRQQENYWRSARNLFAADDKAQAKPKSHFCPCFTRESIEPLEQVAVAQTERFVLELRRERGTDSRIPLGLFAVLTDKKKKRHAWLMRVDDAKLGPTQEGLFVVELQGRTHKGQTVLVDPKKGRVYTVGTNKTGVKILSASSAEVFRNGESQGEVTLR